MAYFEILDLASSFESQYSAKEVVHRSLLGAGYIDLGIEWSLAMAHAELLVSAFDVGTLAAQEPLRAV